MAALDSIAAPVQVVYGSRDEAVDAAAVAAAARHRGGEVVEIGADHFFVGQDATVAEHVAGFLCGHLPGE